MIAQASIVLCKLFCRKEYAAAGKQHVTAPDFQTVVSTLDSFPHWNYKGHTEISLKAERSSFLW